MKTKKFKTKQLLKLHLLKSRIYEYPIKKTNFNDLKKRNLDQILIGVKKALQIIYQYNQANKRILFIGLPSKLEFKINSFNQHVAVSNSFNIQGIISNNKSNLLLDVKNSKQRFSKHYSAAIAPKLAKAPDLIILFDHDKSHTVFSEAWGAKVPVIAFAINIDFRDFIIQGSYFINGNFKNILTAFDKNIFFIGLNFLFKTLKSKQIKSIPVSQNPRLFSKHRKKF
ncbi:30S ribosomal protein S2 (mitochondrion) [Nitzschia inconspicua]|uniref:30S ribosomal protein S2 n=1 Tax=Nitzschia inconspicua TaxID=303405 RepID=A0A8H2SIJ8_9STRA|nr:30S ribosomal protein S2 [Nitzschia inconspicua]